VALRSFALIVLLFQHKLRSFALIALLFEHKQANQLAPRLFIAFGRLQCGCAKVELNTLEQRVRVFHYSVRLILYQLASLNCCGDYKHTLLELLHEHSTNSTSHPPHYTHPRTE
jgi:hypothetical protein